jgi:hypothetical protein
MNTSCKHFHFTVELIAAANKGSSSGIPQDYPNTPGSSLPFYRQSLDSQNIQLMASPFREDKRG